jgi:hypothetical protein
MLLVCVLASCGTRRGYRADDPYLYRRGKWNFAKGGLFDDIPQFTLQMLESMFDYGVQPVDPPSEYETATVLDTADGGSRYLTADAAAAADAAISSGTRAIDAGAPRGAGGAIAAEAAAEAARAAASAAQPEMTWR